MTARCIYCNDLANPEQASCHQRDCVDKLNNAAFKWLTTPTHVSEHEKRATMLMNAESPDNNGPDGSREALEMCCRMIETYVAPEFPADPDGRVPFFRVLCESISAEIKCFLEKHPVEENSDE